MSLGHALTRRQALRGNDALLGPTLNGATLAPVVVPAQAELVERGRCGRVVAPCWVTHVAFYRACLVANVYRLFRFVS